MGEAQNQPDDQRSAEGKAQGADAAAYQQARFLRSHSVQAFGRELLLGVDSQTDERVLLDPAPMPDTSAEQRPPALLMPTESEEAPDGARYAITRLGQGELVNERLQRGSLSPLEIFDLLGGLAEPLRALKANPSLQALTGATFLRCDSARNQSAHVVASLLPQDAEDSPPSAGPALGALAFLGLTGRPPSELGVRALRRTDEDLSALIVDLLNEKLELQDLEQRADELKQRYRDKGRPIERSVAPPPLEPYSRTEEHPSTSTAIIYMTTLETLEPKLPQTSDTLPERDVAPRDEKSSVNTTFIAAGAGALLALVFWLIATARC